MIIGRTRAFVRNRVFAGTVEGERGILVRPGHSKEASGWAEGVTLSWCVSSSDPNLQIPHNCLQRDPDIRILDPAILERNMLNNPARTTLPFPAQQEDRCVLVQEDDVEEEERVSLHGLSFLNQCPSCAAGLCNLSRERPNHCHPSTCDKESDITASSEQRTAGRGAHFGNMQETEMGEVRRSLASKLRVKLQMEAQAERAGFVARTETAHNQVAERSFPLGANFAAPPQVKAPTPAASEVAHAPEAPSRSVPSVSALVVTGAEAMDSIFLDDDEVYLDDIT